MQDRYAGDIGDYGKFGLLRALCAADLSIGINWYKVESLECEIDRDGGYKQNDGKNLIPDHLKICDEQLADVLTQIAVSKNRSIDALEKSNLIDGAVYYQDSLSMEERTQWHENAMKKLAGCDVVFLDPDNGMLVKSVRKKSKRSVKYTLYEEVRDYLKRGQSVLIYNHRCRKPEKLYFDEICTRLRMHLDVNNDQILKITFPRITVRDYLAVCAASEHYNKIQRVFAEMDNGIWGRMGMCRVPGC